MTIAEGQAGGASYIACAGKDRWGESKEALPDSDGKRKLPDGSPMNLEEIHDAMLSN